MIVDYKALAGSFSGHTRFVLIDVELSIGSKFCWLGRQLPILAVVLLAWPTFCRCGVSIILVDFVDVFTVSSSSLASIMTLRSNQHVLSPLDYDFSGSYGFGRVIACIRTLIWPSILSTWWRWP